MKTEIAPKYSNLLCQLTDQQLELEKELKDPELKPERRSFIDRQLRNIQEQWDSVVGPPDLITAAKEEIFRKMVNPN